jgi:hypothetical protein
MPSKPKASFFPYAVMLCMAAMHVLLALPGIYVLLHRPVDPDRAGYQASMLYMMLGADVGYAMISGAFGLASAQWLLERRRINALPGYAAVGMAILNAVLAVGWTFSSLAIVRAVIGTGMVADGLVVASTISAISSYVVQPLLVMLSVWLVFRLLRDREKPMAYPVQVRGRALLIFTLFAWAWLLALLGLSAPVGSTFYAYQGIDPRTFYTVSYSGTLVLLVPSFLGALLALPMGMTATRPVRLWLAATLTLIVSATVMVVVAFAVAALTHFSFENLQPNIGFAVVASLLWFFLSVPLCWLVVKLLTRKRAVFYAGDALPEEVA